MKKTKEKFKEIKQETHPKTYELLKDLEDLLTDKEVYPWG